MPKRPVALPHHPALHSPPFAPGSLSPSDASAAPSSRIPGISPTGFTCIFCQRHFSTLPPSIFHVRRATVGRDFRPLKNLLFFPSSPPPPPVSKQITDDRNQAHMIKKTFVRDSTLYFLVLVCLLLA